MTTLPAAATFQQEPMAAQTLSDALVQMRDFIAEALGTSSDPADALAALGALVSGHAVASSARSVSAADRGRVIVCTGTWALTLAEAATLGAGFAVVVANRGTGTITLTRSGGDQIDGAATAALGPGRAALIVSTGTGWITLALPGTAAGALPLADGTAALPGVAFAGDLDTGLFRQGADALGVSAGGAERLRILSTAVRALVALRLTDGTAAAPAATFESDSDTGLYRAGADALAFAAGGTERLRVTTAGAQVTGQITGTAVTQSATDSTAGRLLKVGDFNIGNVAADPPAVPGGDIDAFNIPSGWYRFNNTSAGTLPPDTAAAFVILQNWWRSAQSIFQMATVRLFSPDRVVVWMRNSTGQPPSGWMPWRRLYSQWDILGAVSESGGVPTGAVIERGSNSNGEYVRFADGTQICTRAVSVSLAIDTAFMGGFRSSGQTWTFPAAFSAAPVFTPVARNLTAFGAVSANVPGTTSATYAVTAVSSQSAATREVALHAVGRWF
jgi:hypothetical protein